MREKPPKLTTWLAVRTGPIQNERRQTPALFFFVLQDFCSSLSETVIGTMSGKIKNRSAANADSISGGVSCDERILRDCHQLYADPDSGERHRFIVTAPFLSRVPVELRYKAPDGHMSAG